MSAEMTYRKSSTTGGGTFIVLKVGKYVKSWLGVQTWAQDIHTQSYNQHLAKHQKEEQQLFYTTRGGE